MEILEKTFKTFRQETVYLNIRCFDDYIEYITGLSNGIPKEFLLQMTQNTQIEYRSQDVRICVYYLFSETFGNISKIFKDLPDKRIVKWECPPNGFEKFYSVLFGNTEVYTFGLYNEYVFPGGNVFIVTYNKYGFKIDDYLSVEYSLN